MTTTPDAGAAAVPRLTGLPRDPRERLKALFDPGTLDLLPTYGDERSGVVAGVVYKKK